jgi:hypothetical protein
MVMKAEKCYDNVQKNQHRHSTVGEESHAFVKFLARRIITYEAFGLNNII